MKSKNLLQSKTVIFNTAVFLLPFVAMFTPQIVDGINAALPKEVAEHIVSIFLAVVALINIYLHTVTKTPVKMSIK